MTLFSVVFSGGALLLLLLGTNNGAHAFLSPARMSRPRPRAQAVSSVPPVPLRSVTPSDSYYANSVSATSHTHKSSRRSAASALAKRAIKGLMSCALKTIPPALVASTCVGAAFPQSALAYTAKDYISHAMKTRHLGVGAAIAVATCAHVIRVGRNPPNDGVPVAAMSMAGATTNGAKKRPAKIPITILSGFLGAGKTTALKRLLENTEGIKVGTIVNDVASVNIDAKLISNPMNNGDRKSGNAVGKGSSGGTVELQNGCACCSLSDELLTSVTDLIEGRDLDAIVVELSGVADPSAVRLNWEQAVATHHPATDKADLSRVVTVVDSHTFGTDWMTWDTAGRRKWTAEGDNCAGSRQVPELLAEQIEAADTLILNKIDLSEGDQLETAKLVVRSLNEKANLVETKFGEITPDKILGNIAENLEKADNDHGHEHSSHGDGTCSDPDCTDSSHSHSNKLHSAADCSDTSHSPIHDHSLEVCLDPDCSDASQSHSHDHNHSSEACVDPDCTDASHSHSHDHKATAADSLGISNFVYKSSKPMNPRKLQKLLLSWPIPVMEELKLVELSKELGKAEEEDSDENSPFVGVLRSKGFCWVSPSIFSGPFNDLDRHDTVMYWSHAGKHFGMKEAGSWWASMGKEVMKQVFEGNMEEYERIINEDFVSGEWGDRRQEIVFIGAKLDEKRITDALDSCLSTDEEIKEYKQAILDAIAEYYAQ